ncbi:MAG: ABC transporter permease, partial [Hyphomicrobiales bacterium]|nr:ABC transporter permease [Hyphomicrobiales bacterium]
MRLAAPLARIVALGVLLALVLTPELFKPVLEPLTENGAP